MQQQPEPNTCIRKGRAVAPAVSIVRSRRKRNLRLVQLARFRACSFHSRAPPLGYQVSSFHDWFVRDFLVSSPRPTRPRPSNPISGSEVAVFGSLLLLSGAPALAVIGALAVSAGVGSDAGGVLAFAVTVVSATGGVLAFAVTVVSAAGGVLAFAVTVVSATGGVLAVAVTVVAAAVGALGVLAVAGAQWSEIIFTAVTATPLFEEPELAATFAFCPMSSTSWPKCGFRSTVLLVILNV
jgi:hypothetical protein